VDNLKLEVNHFGEAGEMVVSQGFEKKPLKAVYLSGSIGSPAEFYRARKEQVDERKDKTHVVVNVQSATVVLVVDETNPYDHYTIEGKMIPFVDFEAFCINTPKRFSKTEIISLLKTNKVYFADKEAWTNLLVTFQKFITTITKELTDSNDDKGKIEKIQSYSAGGEKIDFVSKFTLNIPLFVGESALNFDVEICLDPTSTELKFYLESIDLHAKGKELKEACLARAVASFVNDFPVIYK
jgi:hypothetical protein